MEYVYSELWKNALSKGEGHYGREYCDWSNNRYLVVKHSPWSRKTFFNTSEEFQDTSSRLVWEMTDCLRNGLMRYYTNASYDCVQVLDDFMSEKLLHMLKFKIQDYIEDVEDKRLIRQHWPFKSSMHVRLTMPIFKCDDYTGVPKTNNLWGEFIDLSKIGEDIFSAIPTEINSGSECYRPHFIMFEAEINGVNYFGGFSVMPPIEHFVLMVSGSREPISHILDSVPYYYYYESDCERIRLYHCYNLRQANRSSSKSLFRYDMSKQTHGIFTVDVKSNFPYYVTRNVKNHGFLSQSMEVLERAIYDLGVRRGWNYGRTVDEQFLSCIRVIPCALTVS